MQSLFFYFMNPLFFENSVKIVGIKIYFILVIGCIVLNVNRYKT